MNVWSPNVTADAKLPVMVFIQGGGKTSLYADESIALLLLTLSLSRRLHVAREAMDQRLGNH